MTIQEKIASLPHVDTIKDKVRDVMYFRTDNPDLVIKVRINWEKIYVSERIAERQKLIEQKNIINDQQLAIEQMHTEVEHVQSQIDEIENEHENWS